MLGLLCPECSIVKILPPPALGPRVQRVDTTKSEMVDRKKRKAIRR